MKWIKNRTSILNVWICFFLQTSQRFSTQISFITVWHDLLVLIFSLESTKKNKNIQISDLQTYNVLIFTNDNVVFSGIDTFIQKFDTMPVLTGEYVVFTKYATLVATTGDISLYRHFIRA